MVADVGELSPRIALCCGRVVGRKLGTSLPISFGFCVGVADPDLVGLLSGDLFSSDPDPRDDRSGDRSGLLPFSK